MNGNGESIFGLFNELRELSQVPELLQDALDKWRPPQFLTIGVESSGKDTILERLTMMPIFPRGRHRYISCAFHVFLRYGPEERRTLEEIELGSGAIRVLADPLDPQDCDAGRIAEEMRGLAERHAGTHGICTSHGLAVRIVGPHCPHLDLVDMPGLVFKPKERDMAVRQLLEDHFSKNEDRINVVAAVPAFDRPSNNIAMEWLRDRQLLNRTCGVFTMVDHVAGEAHEIVSDLCSQSPQDDDGDGRVMLEPFGWVATMSRRLVGDKESPTTFDEMRSQVGKEREYFEQCADLKDLWTSGRCCIGSVLARIRIMYRMHLVSTLGPALAFRLDHEHRHLRFQHMLLGMPEPHEMLDPVRSVGLIETVTRMVAANIEQIMPALLTVIWRDVLKPFKLMLICLLKVPLGTMQVGGLNDKWFELRGILRKESKTTVEKVAELLCAGLMQATNCREPVPLWPSPEALDLVADTGDHRAPVQVRRFSEAIHAFERHLTDMLAKWQVDCRQEVDKGIEELFTLSRFRRFSTNFDLMPPTVTVDILYKEFVDSLMYIMLQQLELLGRAQQTGAFVEPIARNTQWKEDCASQRDFLLSQMELISAARRSLLHDFDCPDEGAGKDQGEEYRHPSWAERRSRAIEQLRQLHDASARCFRPGVTTNAPCRTQVDSSTEFTIKLYMQEALQVQALPAPVVGGVPNQFAVSLFKIDVAHTVQTRIDASHCSVSIEDRGAYHKVKYSVNKEAFSHQDSPHVKVCATLHGAPVLGTPFISAAWAPHFRGNLLCSFGDAGEEDGQFLNPTYIATYADFIYVSDYNNSRVSIFQLPPLDTGQSGERAPQPYGSWGTWGAEEGQLKQPRGIAVRRGRVYVVDSGNQRVQVFDNGQDGGEPGAFLFQFGKAGSGQGQFNTPEDICLDEEYAYVSDLKANRVVQFRRLGGQFIKDFLVGGNAVGVDVDEEYLFVATNAKNCVYKLNKDNGQIVLCTSFSWQPCGIAIDEEHIYLTTHRPNNIVSVHKRGNHAHVMNYNPFCSYVWGCAVSLHALYLVDYEDNCVKVIG